MAMTRVGRRIAVISLIATAALAQGCALPRKDRDVGDTYTYETTEPPAPAAPAEPATADPQAASIEAVPMTEPGRTSLRVTGSGFGSEDVIALTIDDLAAGVARADANGSFTATIALPAGNPAAHTIRAAGRPSGRTATARVTA